MANVYQLLRKFHFAAWIIGLSMATCGLSLAQTIPLSTSPLETATTTAVLPNVMFMLDDSGSMAWDYMPDPALNFSGRYGFNSSQCNGMAYNPNINYTPPVTSTGAILNSATPTTFTAAYLNGFSTGLGTVNLNSQFTGGSGSGSSGENLGNVPAFYYTYSGTQTLPVQQNYFNTNSTFYKECNSNIGSGPGSGVFTKTTLSSTAASTITISGNVATITVGGGTTNTSVTGITVGGTQIMGSSTNTTTSTTTLAAYIQSKINQNGYSATVLGSVVTIYGPSPAAGATPVITKGGGNLTVTVTTPFPAVTATQVTSITVNGTAILLAGPAPAAATTSESALAASIAAKITAAGYSATVNATAPNVVLLSGPASAVSYTPAITLAAGSLTLTPAVFTGSTPAQLQNFANWYSYYSHRMIMMKTVAGQAFAPINSSYRVGFMTMNNNVPPDFVNILPFNAAQKATWYSTFYASIPSNGTPLRDALSHVGQLYANKIGASTQYTDTITITCPAGDTSYTATGGCSNTASTSGTHFVVGSPYIITSVGSTNFTSIGASSNTVGVEFNATGAGTGTGTAQLLDAANFDIVDSVIVNAPGTLNTTPPVSVNDNGNLFDLGVSATCPTDPVSPPICSSTTALANAISNAINSMVISDYGSTVSGNVVTVTGPAPALGYTPVINDTTNMNETATAFTAHTTIATLNGVTPLDPMQYSCQQNFIILDTDGYWNTGSTWDMNNVANAIGNTDGTTSYTVAATAQTWGPEARPMLDGTNTSNTLADVAEYYYQTDLRDPAWSNQTGTPITIVNAGSFVVGTQYSITTVGTTNFTAIGAASNTPGIHFTATGVGAGTGTAGLLSSANDVSNNNVPTSIPGTYTHQNMVTFTLGLGARGNMTYSPTYQTDSFGDYYSIANGSLATGSAACATNLAGLPASPTPAQAANACVCNWQTVAGSVCNWSVPSTAGAQNNIDDLWHAAVNGRGQYFAASDPATLASGLYGALAGIHAIVGAASAAAVSSPNITQSSDSIFSSTYTTDYWDGDVTMQTINPISGTVSTAITWCSDGSTATSTGALVTAGSFTTGTIYQIASVGTTSFTSIGASANTVGAIFTATGAGAGTGTANVYTPGCPTTSMLDLKAQTDCLNNGSESDPPTCGTPDISVSRTIYTFDSTNAYSNYLKPFLYNNAAWTAAEQGFFNNHCSLNAPTPPNYGMSQCTSSILTASQQTTANTGLYLVDYLRGNQWFESPNTIYRSRIHIEGDSVNAAPVYVAAPTFSFTDTTVYSTGAAILPANSYASYQAAQAARQAVLYVAANDGMLHAFNALTGVEMWAYVPKMLMPYLYKLADVNYPTQHQYYVDGTPVTMDIYVDGATTTAPNLAVGWHTILVGGLGLGGRGFYALDVTNPASPKALWEFCADSTLCVHSDTDMGYSSGNPVITKRSSDGRWVVLVTSGYNNGTYMTDNATVSTNSAGAALAGSGENALFELDAATGTKLNKTLFGSGTAASPSGFAKISPWFDSPQINMTTRFIYGGDLNGNVWRLDLGPPCTPTPCSSNYTPTATEIASLKDSTGVAQPVTTRPELGDPLNTVTNSLAVPASGMPAVFVATGEYLGIPDLTNYQVQTMYAIEDNLSLSGAAAYYGNPRSPNAGFNPFVHQYIYSPTSTTRTTSQNAVNWTTQSGWYADFQVDTSPTNVPVAPSPSPGERVNIDPQLINGTLIVVSNVPNSNACTAGGASWLYSFNFLTGTNVSSSANGNAIVATMLGSGTALTAGFTIVSLQGGTIQAEITSATGQKSNVSPPLTAGSTKRTSWRELTQ